MDHRVGCRRVILAFATAGLLALLLPGVAQAAADPEAALTSATHAQAAPARSGQAAAETGLAPREAADDPESRPVAHSDKTGASSASEEDTGSLAASVAGKLALVVALILACAAAWKRYHGGVSPTGPPSGQPVRVTSTIPLGPQRFLHIVTVGRHQLLLASSPQSIGLIATLDENASLVEISPLPTGAPRTDGPAQEQWADPVEEAARAVSPVDRFEELLLRLRGLEPGPDPASEAGGRPVGRRVEPAGAEREFGLGVEGRIMRPVAGSSERLAAGPLAPGSLFRSSPRAAGGEPDA